MVFGKAVPKESPVTGKHTATATVALCLPVTGPRGAHLPSLVKRGGWGGGPRKPVK